MYEKARKRISQTASILSFFLLVLASAATAGDFEDGVSAANRGDYTTALKLWRPLAAQGDAVAQFNIGISYLNGYGVPKDTALAEKWFRSAAQGGNASAQNALGNMLSPQNPEGSVGRASEAASWYLKAAEQGFARAQVSLGLLCEGGMGVPKDPVQALKWYTLAAMNARDEKGRDFAVKNFNALAQGMPPDQIAKAQQLASEWKPQLKSR